jgi:hypothetical protein
MIALQQSSQGWPCKKWRKKPGSVAAPWQPCVSRAGLESPAIERLLTNAEWNAVSAAYNFAEHLPERRKMMQAWADYSVGLKAGA